MGKVSKTMKLLRAILPPLTCLLLLILSACATPLVPQQLVPQVNKLFPSFVEPTRTPFQPIAPTPTRTVTPTPTPVPFQGLYIWLDPAMPSVLKKQIHLPEDSRLVNDPSQANLEIGALRGGDQLQTTWVYALVVPFPTVTDEISLDEIQRAWRGESGQVFTGPLLLSETTRAAFAARWGPPAGDRLEIQPENKLLNTAWDNRPSWAIVPFENLDPQWKVLRVNGQSPVEREFDLANYPLTVWFGVNGKPDALQKLNQLSGQSTLILPASNRDPNKLTVLVMTGVTALTRATGYKMDTLGTTYPGRDIQDWLRNADLTHISNEVSFNPDCPKANFMDTSTMFCSRPEYIKLLDFIGTDILELSGNHNNDWGRQADTYSLELYRQHNFSYFAGGANLAEAREPLKMEHNGNKLAFIGCNPVGPGGAWATDSSPGAAPCDDYAWMLDAIRQVKSEGYLPIVTFQYFELYTPAPSDHQMRDFRAAIDAGAVIVSGSQAHFPQIMEFYQGQFIHYGLGNLFFDQMDVPVPGTRKEFIDRHVFYDGHYIQTQLLTALLEDYARPRPMSDSERSSFLAEYFQDSGW